MQFFNLKKKKKLINLETPQKSNYIKIDSDVFNDIKSDTITLF